MSTKKGYVAHPILDRHMVRDWIADIMKRTGITLVNPIVDVEKEEEHDLKASETGDYSAATADQIVLKDLDALVDCDFTVAFVTGNRSYGTIMEIVYAALSLKPVFIVCTNGHDTHPWLAYHATKTFKTVEEFEDYVNEHAEDFGIGDSEHVEGEQ